MAGGICFIFAVATESPNVVLAQTSTPLKTVRTAPTLPLNNFYDTPHPLPPGKPGELIRSEPINQYSLPYELSALRILYHSRSTSGDDVAVSGVVLIPDGKPPSGGWPVIAWAHDFRGAARQCAPSLMRNLGAGPILAMYANLGYVVVATDYSGLGADSGKAVLDMQSNGLDVMYSVPAARAAVPQAGAKWMAIGPFQGALSAVAVAESDVHDPNLVGSIATSGLGDTEEAYQSLVRGSSYRMFEVAWSVRTLYPEFQVSDMLTDIVIPAYEQFAQDCGRQLRPEFDKAMVKSGLDCNRFVTEFFSRNTPGQKPAHAPLLVINGEADRVIQADVASKVVSRMCKAGDRVLFLKYSGLDASGAMGASVADQVSWIKARFAGAPAPSNCP